jgi:hypothetical protein
MGEIVFGANGRLGMVMILKGDDWKGDLQYATRIDPLYFQQC